MKSQLIAEWDYPVGTATVWQVSAESRAAFEASGPGGPPSAIQDNYLRVTQRGPSGIRNSRLGFITFTIDAVYDEQALSKMFIDHIRRHGTYHTGFSYADGVVTSKTIDPELITLSVSHHLEHDGVELNIRDYIEAATPDISEWCSFIFAALGTDAASADAEDPKFTVVIVVDHLYADAVSMAGLFLEMILTYNAVLADQPMALPPAENYTDHARREVAYCQSLNADSPEIGLWRDFLVGNDGHLPSFPLPLGLPRGSAVPAKMLASHSFADAEECAAFDRHAKAAGGGFMAGVYAVAALIAELANPSLARFSTMTPRANRKTPESFFGVGWYASLSPYQVELRRNQSFTSLVAPSQAAINHGKTIEGTPIYRAAELLGNEPGIHIDKNFAAPMISFIDLRKLPGADLVEKHKLAVFGNKNSAREVFTWINRDHAGIDINLLYPDTEASEQSVHAYRDAFVAMFRHIVHTGDFDLTRDRLLLPEVRRIVALAENDSLAVSG